MQLPYMPNTIFPLLFSFKEYENAPMASSKSNRYGFLFSWPITLVVWGLVNIPVLYYSEQLGENRSFILLFAVAALYLGLRHYLKKRICAKIDLQAAEEAQRVRAMTPEARAAYEQEVLQNWKHFYRRNAFIFWGTICGIAFFAMAVQLPMIMLGSVAFYGAIFLIIRAIRKKKREK